MKKSSQDYQKSTSTRKPRSKKSVQEKNELKTTGRIMATGMLLFFAFSLGAIGKDFTYLAIKGEKNDVNLRERAYSKYATQEVVRSKRGTIYDRTGSPLAEELTSYKIYANLNEKYGKSYVQDIEWTAEQLSQKLPMSKEAILERLSTPKVSQVEFGAAGRALSFLEMTEIKEMNLPGIEFIESSNRFYPNGTFASHSLGYAVFDPQENRLVGHMGLELAFDEALAGQNGLKAYMRDRKGYLLPNTEKEIQVDPIDGLDIYTTLDFNVQDVLENALSSVEAEFNPENVIAVVADAKTGAIVAAANRKTFDPNNRDVENYYNPIIQHPFEPGSTIKVYTYAAAINEGKYNGNKYYETGATKIGGMNIKDWKYGGWGTITLDQGFYISSNTGIMNLLSQSITTETYVDYLKAFGFGEPTGLELPDESGGTLPRDNDYTNQLTSGFGQGFLTTPMQHIRAMTAIINDGQMMQPYLVAKTYDPNTGETKVTQPQVVGNPVTAQTAQQVRELMWGAVNDADFGSGYTSYRMTDIEVAGKTGTAQIADEVNGGYLRGSNDYIYSFVGFAPYDDPEYIVYLSLDRPKPGRLSGHGILGEVFRTIMTHTVGSSTLTQIEDESKVETISEEIQIKNYRNQPLTEVLEDVEALGLVPVVIGEGDIVYAQSAKVGTTLVSGEKLFIQTGDEVALPDFKGWTHRELITYLSLTNLPITLEGQGPVAYQSVEAGTLIKDLESCHVVLSHKEYIPQNNEEEVSDEVIEEESTETDEE